MIYFMADDSTDLAMAEMFGSKNYVRQLQRFGGKASVVFDEITRWFAGLWVGKTLSLTVLVLTVAVAALLFLVGRYSRD